MMEEGQSEKSVDISTPMMQVSFENEPAENEKYSGDDNEKEMSTDIGEKATLLTKPEMPTLVKGGLKFVSRPTELSGETED
jgi:hypothetical protein